MSSMDLSQAQRQSPIGVAVIFFKNLRMAINVFVSIFFIQFGLQVDLMSGFFWSITAGIGLVFLVISYFQYRKFFFFVKDDNFVIEKGLVQKDRITIPFDRIQSVNISQNLIQQLLNVVGLKIDTAGSKQKELEIAALPKAYARELQKFLIDKKKEEIREDEEATRIEKEQLDEVKPLIALKPIDLFRIGFTENHLRTGLALVAVIYGYLWQYEEYLMKPFEPYIEEQADYWLGQWLILLPIAIVLFFIVSVLLSLIQTFLRYFKLRFFVDRKGVQFKAGLIRKIEYQIPVNKIQYLKWKSNPLRKLIGLRTLVIKQASSDQAQDRQSISVPGCREEQLQVVLDEFYHEWEGSDETVIKADQLLLIQILFWLGLVPTLILAGLGYFQGDLFYKLAPFFLLNVAFFGYRYSKTVNLQLNQEVLVLRKGWVYPQSNILSFYKLQNVKLSQSIFQKRRKLMHLTFHTASGSLRMPHIPEAIAKELYNFALYKIESSNRSWM